MDLGNFAQLASAVVALTAFVTSIWAARSKRHEEAITALREDVGRAFRRIDGAEQRLARTENELAHLPNKDMVHALQIGMAELKGQMAALVERVTPLARSMDRVEASLMERSEK